jgi:hypothetical protein
VGSAPAFLRYGEDMKTLLRVVASAALGFALASSCGGGGSGASFKWYGTNPPVVNNRCEYLGVASDGTQVWQCTPL